jgi:hypothetical protein
MGEYKIYLQTFRGFRGHPNGLWRFVESTVEPLQLTLTPFLGVALTSLNKQGDIFLFAFWGEGTTVKAANFAPKAHRYTIISFGYAIVRARVQRTEVVASFIGQVLATFS